MSLWRGLALVRRRASPRVATDLLGPNATRHTPIWTAFNWLARPPSPTASRDEVGHPSPRPPSVRALPGFCTGRSAKAVERRLPELDGETLDVVDSHEGDVGAFAHLAGEEQQLGCGEAFPVCAQGGELTLLREGADEMSGAVDTGLAVSVCALLGGELASDEVGDEVVVDGAGARGRCRRGRRSASATVFSAPAQQLLGSESLRGQAVERESCCRSASSGSE